MSWTKRQFVNQAFEEIGYASWEFDLQPAQIQSAMRRLDMMVASWNAKGIRLGYPIPSSPENSDLDQETNVPDLANQAIVLNLALQLAPSFGKTVQPETRASAKDAYDAILLQATTPPEMQLPGTMPAGAGHKSWRDTHHTFLPDPEDPVDVGEDAPLTLE